MTTTATQNRLRLAVIIGSTRENRFAETVANWFVEHVAKQGEMELDVIDLLDVKAPAVHQREKNPELLDFVERVDAADAFVVITPEYNHGYPASLKFAIDSAHSEWNAKPVGFVSYGGVSGGLRAVEQLRQVFAELHAVTVRDTVSLHWAGALFDTAGGLHESEQPELAAKIMLDQLGWWGRALSDARKRHPYGQ